MRKKETIRNQIIVFAVILALGVGGLYLTRNIEVSSGSDQAGASILSFRGLLVPNLFKFSGTSAGLGTTSPTSNAEFSIESVGTSTLYIVSGSGLSGGCIQIEGPASTTFRLYATTTGPAIIETGTCK